MRSQSWLAIDCSETLVRALLARERWQLSRPVRVPAGHEVEGSVEHGGRAAVVSTGPGGTALTSCPYGDVGQWLYVRERFWARGRAVAYAASEARALSWQPMAAMRPEQARLWLRLYRVQARRLQHTGGFSMRGEGVLCEAHDTDHSHCMGDHCELQRAAYARRWDSVFGEHPTLCYAADPWVWGVSYTVYTAELATQLMAAEARERMLGASCERAKASAMAARAARAKGRVSHGVRARAQR